MKTAIILIVAVIMVIGGSIGIGWEWRKIRCGHGYICSPVQYVDCDSTGITIIGYGNTTDDPNDFETIHHPIYGSYPAEIKGEQGMTLMPGQSATFEFEIETR